MVFPKSDFHSRVSKTDSFFFKKTDHSPPILWKSHFFSSRKKFLGLLDSSKILLVKSFKKSFSFHILLYDWLIGFIAICPSKNDQKKTSCECNNYCDYEESCSNKAVLNCLSTHTSLCGPEITLCSPSWSKRKVLKQWLFQHSYSEFDLPCFHQLVTGFHGNGKWNKHSSF